MWRRRGRKFSQTFGVHGCVLADVERVQVKTESANFSQQWIHEQFGQALPVVFHQADAQQQKVALQFIRRSISVWTARLIAGVAQSDAHEIQEVAA